MRGVRRDCEFVLGFDQRLRRASALLADSVVQLTASLRRCGGVAAELNVVRGIETGHGHFLQCNVRKVVGNSGRRIGDGADVSGDVGRRDFLGTGVDALPAENVLTVALTDEGGYSLECVCCVCVCVCDG